LAGFTYNVQIRGDTLSDLSGWSDPLTGRHFPSAHNGESSVYYGGLSHLLGFDAGHVAAGVGDDTNNPGLEAHYDTFGPLNPLHWFLEYLPSLIINPRGSASAEQYTCTAGVGCQ
jgi:hypothetical protein